jgi:hypothetical protein
VTVQRLGLSLALIILAAILLMYSRVPDDRTRGNVAQQSPRAGQSPGGQPSPSTGVLSGRVTMMVPPTTGPEGGGSPGPVPGGSSAPVAAASVGIAPLGSSHIWWVVTSVDGSYLIAVPPGTYRVTMENRPGMGVAKNLPATVTVKAGQQTRLDIHFDTGLR